MPSEFQKVIKISCQEETIEPALHLECRHSARPILENLKLDKNDKQV